MKQVDADGLELITVNGGELKPTQGGGETPSMATVIAMQPLLHRVLQTSSENQVLKESRLQGAKKRPALLLFCSGVSRLPPVSFYRGVMRTKVHCLLTTGFSVLPLRVSGPSDVETARARAQPLLSRPRRPLSEDLNICSILRDATRTPQTPNPPIIPK
jgi:hypothetical protein